MLGNLLRVELPCGITVEYLVDGLNRRTGKKVNGVLTQGFLYRDALKPAAELDAAGNLVSRFVYGARSVVPDYLVKGGVTYRILSDQLGSPRLVIDVATGAIAQRLDFDEYGRILLDTNPGFQPFGFAGGLYVHQTGLVRFGARDYDPEVGRWTAKDPIGFGGGDGDVFSYSRNDPINVSDPSGLQPGRSPWEPLLPAGCEGFSGVALPQDVPDGVSLADNIDDAIDHLLNVFWFRDKVRQGGEWDYKTQNGQEDLAFEQFGNFNYGATGAALGIPRIVLLNEAGRAQVERGTSQEGWGEPGPSLLPFLGKPPYGDDPRDQYWIEQGIKFFENWMVGRFPDYPCDCDS